MRSLNIHIAVGGRFHSDYMAKALTQAGHRVKLHTTFPSSRFPELASNQIKSVLFPEMLFRLGGKVGLENLGDRAKMRLFGQALSKDLLSQPQPPDLLVAWSSFGLEALREEACRKHVIMRDSSHIIFQDEVLRAEYEKLRLPFGGRNFCIDRELEEYDRADAIFVLSEFARKTFIEAGILPAKIFVLRLGVDGELFKAPEPHSFELPLRVVFFGLIGVRKGVQYLLDATKNFSPNMLELSLIGPVEPMFRGILAKYPHAKLYPPMPQSRLAQVIQEMDVFCFPTVEDGFGQTLIQAMAAGLVPITTDHCGAAECVHSGMNGFIVPASDSRALVECLSNLIDHPSQLEAMKAELRKSLSVPSWMDYGLSLTHLVEGLFAPSKNRSLEPGPTLSV